MSHEATITQIEPLGLGDRSSKSHIKPMEQVYLFNDHGIKQEAILCTKEVIPSPIQKNEQEKTKPATKVKQKRRRRRKVYPDPTIRAVQDTLYRCMTCRGLFSKISDLQGHACDRKAPQYRIETNMSDGGHNICSKCILVFETTMELVDHNNDVHKTVTCKVCKMQFKNKSQCSKHQCTVKIQDVMTIEAPMIYKND